MSEIELLDTVVTMENIFCIYRNYMMLDRRARKIAVARVAFLFILYSASCVGIFIDTVTTLDDKFMILLTNLYATLTSINSLIPISMAIVQSHVFKILLTNISAVHEYCREGARYKRRLHNLRKRIVCLMTAFAVCYTVSFTINSLQWTALYNDVSLYSTTVGLIQSILANWKDIRFQFEFLIFHAFIRIIIISLGHLHSTLLMLLKTLGESKDGIDNSTCLRLQRELENWASAYKGLAVCSDSLKKCFGIQVIFSVLILVLYCIGLSCNWVATLMSKASGSVGLAAALLLNYTWAIMLLIYSGQWAKNEGDRLNRLMAKFYSTLLTIPGSNMLELRRSVKALHRQMAVQPIKIQILSTTNVEMSLLLGIVSTVVSYTIVLLQFTHIV